ncbi:transposase [Muricoccus pecuniae]|uniref:Transposase n=1 Tax=Muricoccus pecuniae TaxID=693023 RepID=A0A840Y958_9PROT|nr:transposase [Roseomonas pecuniae]MBB5692907.1 transposase [Roseomonas pecuniae]
MPLPHAPRLTPPAPWSPLTDLQFHALLPYLLPRSLAGRKIADLRARMDAILHLTATTAPWREAPAADGTPATVARYYRRLTHNGLWERLLVALAEAAPGHPLRQIEHLIVRACRRAHRMRGIGLLVLIRRLGLRSALNGPPWLLPDPDLSETLARAPHPLGIPRSRAGRLARAGYLRAVTWLLKAAEGRARIPRSVRLAWP